jgi:transposase, IS6 family
MMLLCVRCDLRYALSYRNEEEFARERGLAVDHTTVLRWVQRYAPELDQRCRRHLRAPNDAYRIDETYININKQWYDLSRAVDSTGTPLDTMPNRTRAADTAERFFRQVL